MYVDMGNNGVIIAAINETFCIKNIYYCIFSFLFRPLQIFGCWVWILVAATTVYFPMLQGWVMYVSVSSFIISLLLLMSYLFDFHKKFTSWKIMVRGKPKRTPTHPHPIDCGHVTSHVNCQIDTVCSVGRI